MLEGLPEIALIEISLRDSLASEGFDFDVKLRA